MDDRLEYAITCFLKEVGCDYDWLKIVLFARLREIDLSLTEAITYTGILLGKAFKIPDALYQARICMRIHEFYNALTDHDVMIYRKAKHVVQTSRNN